MAAAFVAKAALTVVGLGLVRLQPPQLVLEFLYSECSAGCRAKVLFIGGCMGWCCSKPQQQSPSLRSPLPSPVAIGLYAILSFAMDGPAAAASALIGKHRCGPQHCAVPAWLTRLLNSSKGCADSPCPPASHQPAPCCLLPAGMQVSPHFDSPWSSTSLADFWSRRWDLAAGNTLRKLVYEPVLEGEGMALAGRAGLLLLQCQVLVARGWVAGGSPRAWLSAAGFSAYNGDAALRCVHAQWAPPSLLPLPGRLVRTAAPPLRATRGAAASAAKRHRRRRLVGSASCFLVSAAMHELQFWYMTGRHSGGLMLAFFLAQVPLLSGERQLGGVLRWAGPAAGGVSEPWSSSCTTR